MQIIYVIIAIITITITIIKAKKYTYDAKKSISMLLTGMAITLTVLVFPLAEGNNPIAKLVYSIIYSAQTIIISEDVSLITSVELQNIIDIVYVGIIYILFLAMPLLTVSFLLSILNDFSTKIKLMFIQKRKIIIFSNLNEKSLTIAENQKDKNTAIIFANYTKEEVDYNKRLNTIKALKIKEEIENIEFKHIKNKEITIYIMLENEEKKLNTTLELIEKYKNLNIKIYLITSNEISENILDSVDKGEIKLEIVDEIERTVCEVLQEKPIYLNTINNEISVLIVGGGKVGQEFLKAITWCGQIIGYTLKITLIDIKADSIKEKLMLNYPELIQNYNYEFIQVDVNSIKLEEKLQKLNNINYIIVTLNDEEQSLKQAMFLRRYFINKNDTRPIINIWIENNLKNEQVNKLINEKGNSYDIHAFGSINQMYNTTPIINSKLEKMTKNVHLSYSPQDTELKEFYKKNYNIKSSRAFALHIKYKIYSILKEKYTGKEEIDKKLFEQYIKEEAIMNKLIINEHNRWMAYMRSIGFKKATIEDVQKYKTQTNHHVNFLGKLHPALVEYDQLKEVEQKIGVPLQNKDRMILCNIGKIMKE